MDRESIERTRKIIAEKQSLGGKTKALCMLDVQRVLAEYFDISSKVEFSAVPCGEKVEVKISFTADRIKGFTVLK